MQIVIVDSKTKKINERVTHRYWNAMRNSTFMDIPQGMRLSIRSDKDSVKSGNKVSKYSCNR